MPVKVQGGTRHDVTGGVLDIPLITGRPLSHSTTYEPICAIMREGRRLYGRVFFIALSGYFMTQICRSILGTFSSLAGILSVMCSTLGEESRTSNSLSINIVLISKLGLLYKFITDLSPLMIVAALRYFRF